MNDEVLTGAVLGNDANRSGDAVYSRGAADVAKLPSEVEDARTVAVAATFTADLLKQPLLFWLKKLHGDAQIMLAPYGQLMQELLNPESLLMRNRHGFNVILLRPEDWIRDRIAQDAAANIAHIDRMTREFAAALAVLRARSSATLLVVICPMSSELAPRYGERLQRAEAELYDELRRLPNTYCWNHAEVTRLYPVANCEDRRADRIGHIPYTEAYFAAVATLLARRMTALLKPQYKVIAIDCDNTLWRGVCGEDGAVGVELTAAHLELQRLLVRQHDAGMLLCLCSKNNPGDVEAVFSARSEMPLREAHLVGSRINWNAKSTNLHALAEELDLGLDSFILIDDSALECAEVRAHCPGVLVLQLPQAAAEIAHFLDHVWAFDRVCVTDEAAQRTLQYKQNRARKKASQSAGDLEQFVASLELQVDIDGMRSEHMPRVAELTQRTNQFNFTTLRRRASELEVLMENGELDCRIVHVRDRFGDYGLVGVVLLRRRPQLLEVDTFLLSCRVLGRGVEYRIINELGRIAGAEGRDSIVLRYRRTARNTPAWTFLENSFARFADSARGEDGAVASSTFIVPTEYARDLRGAFSEGGLENEKAPPTATVKARQSLPPTWHETAYRFSRIDALLEEMHRSAPQARLAKAMYAAPRTEQEIAVAQAWTKILRVQNIGIHDDFFELGGDSLSAVQVIANVGATLGLELSLYEFFEAPTVAQVAAQLSNAAAAGPAIEPAVRIGPLPLSSAQQRLWLIDRLEGSAAYHIPLMTRLHGDLNVAALQAALDALLDRHEALCTVFDEVAGTPEQRVVQHNRFALQGVDLSALDPAQREVQVSRHLREELSTPFDLSTGPLIRGRLLRIAADEHVLLITMHHIVSDGWSIGVLIRELGVLYAAHATGEADPLPPLPIQYIDYAQWHRQWIASAHVRKQLAYWKEHLEGAPELLELPTDRRRPATQSYRGDNVEVVLDKALTRELNALARSFGLTLAMTLHAAWVILLSRLSGERDIVVGMPVANRRRAEIENLIGFFVNTLPVRVRLNPEAPLADLLRQVKEVLLAAYDRQDAPFEQVVEALQPARTLSHAPIFQTVFVLQNAPRSLLRFPGLTLAEQEVPLDTAQFDLTLQLQESKDEIRGWLNYATDLYDHATAVRWAGCLQTLLQAMASNVQQPVAKLPLLSAPERRQIIELFNATERDYPRTATVHQLFEQQAARAPHAVAVVDESQSLSYAQLNSQANQLACYLRRRGVAVGDYVPLLMARSAKLLVAQLAVLKCGAVYVPIDPELPPDRQLFMIRDCGALGIVADDPQPMSLDLGAAWWVSGRQVATEVAAQPTDNLSLPRHDLPAAYVMYTSGSTGVPKGVVVPHHAVTRLAINNGYAQIGAEDCIAHYSNTSFDASTFEVWAALLNGARVAVIPQAVVLNGARFAEVLREQGVTMLYISVGLFNQYAQVLKDVFAGLRYLMVGGDVLVPESIRSVLLTSPPQNLLNAYGPTECTTFSTTQRIREVGAGAASIPIGRPMANARIYILDEHGEVVPIGVTGELYIGGAGVARGYLQRPELTAKRFLPDPFSADAQARLYRSGDLGCWRADGTIEYRGRNDRQVKIRGFRIEPEEIEAQLLRHAGVEQAVVLARQDAPGEKRLVSYIVAPAATAAPAAEDLRRYLSSVLPEYMVPSAFVTLERLPLTSSGKIDRRALPAPDRTAYAARVYEPPQGKLEETLAALWQVLLQVERIGRHDNFFELGGHSLSAMQLSARVQSLLHVEMPMRLLFEFPVLQQLAAQVDDLRRRHLHHLIEAGDSEIDQLIDAVASMSEHDVGELLKEITTEDRP